MSEERGYGLKPEERTESQQQKCVSASATIGALLRYICRRDEVNQARREEYESVHLSTMSKDAREACDARAHDESAAPRNPPAGSTTPILVTKDLWGTCVRRIT